MVTVLPARWEIPRLLFPLLLPVVRLVDLPVARLLKPLITGTVTLLVPQVSRRCTAVTPVIVPD